ncbi:hypothetical protein LCGC14_1053950 [marine sediment metagenome]|uniref:Uncharacterized protein n=1 Tax=marine sediment metagenome TaxID=412755 RepID=A0A0F9Q614_9ZZZZ
MSRYTKEHYEGIAGLLAKYHASPGMCLDFADLFAADNPEVCRYCGDSPTAAKVRCVGHEGDPFHNFEGGFNREQFLEACGLETETEGAHEDVDTFGVLLERDSRGSLAASKSLPTKEGE